MTTTETTTTSTLTTSTPTAGAEATRRHRVLSETPIGRLVVVADGDDIAAVWMTEQRHAPDPATHGEPAPDGDELLEAATRQLEEYFAGSRTEFDLPLAAEGTSFQQTVWAALSEIPYGETWSYGELAEHIGRPGAARAVGLANGRNPISVVVPCHRVVGSTGSLTGYGGGIERKRTLLDLERRAAVPALFDGP